MWQFVIDIQRDIYFGFADHIKAFANGTGWAAFIAFLPMGVAFGAVHAMTPGHSKSILATYVAGSSLGMLRGLLVSFALSFTHVTMSVIIALFSLPLVSIMFGGAGPGSSPILQNVSRGLLGVIGVWMLWSAFFREPHSHDGVRTRAVRNRTLRTNGMRTYAAFLSLAGRRSDRNPFGI